MGIRILVADDDPDIVLSLSERLRWLGHDVVAASDGQAAVMAVESHAIDLAFLDIGMPRLGGIEALKRIRQRWPNLPVVVLTAYGTIRLAVDAMKEGAIDFITKPFEPGQLDSVVATAMERGELKGEVTQLLGEISHDVKNMLMPLVTGTDLLAEEIGDLFKTLPEMEAVRTQQSHHVCEEVIRMLRNSSQRIQDRMKSIADYVAVTSAPQNFEPCQIAKIAGSVAKSLHVLVKQRQLVLQLVGLDSLPPIMADENRLFSALYNLVHNAIPEVPAGGSITIRGFHDTGDQFISVTVQDTGKGMPPEIRDNLFTKRLVSRKSGGTGLGTKIVKDAVDTHGGQITVDSGPGKGTTFHIRLPIHQPTPLRSASSSVRADSMMGW
jgi:signal transduction histidine kinase